MYENSEATVGLCVILMLAFFGVVAAFAIFSDKQVRGCYLEKSIDSHAIKLKADKPWQEDPTISTHNDTNSAIQAAKKMDCIIKVENK